MTATTPTSPRPRPVRLTSARCNYHPASLPCPFTSLAGPARPSKTNGPASFLGVIGLSIGLASLLCSGLSLPFALGLLSRIAIGDINVAPVDGAADAVARAFSSAVSKDKDGAVTLNS